jgi:hypothetical protein
MLERASAPSRTPSLMLSCPGGRDHSLTLLSLSCFKQPSACRLRAFTKEVLGEADRGLTCLSLPLLMNTCPLPRATTFPISYPSDCSPSLSSIALLSFSVLQHDSPRPYALLDAPSLYGHPRTRSLSSPLHCVPTSALLVVILHFQAVPSFRYLDASPCKPARPTFSLSARSDGSADRSATCPKRRLVFAGWATGGMRSSFDQQVRSFETGTT